MLTKTEFRALLKSDLADRELNQKKFAYEFVMRGEQLSPVAITHWVSQGFIPQARLRMALEILGENSRLAQVPISVWEELWHAAKNAEQSEAQDRIYRVSEAPVVTEYERVVAQRTMVPSIVAEVRRYTPPEYKAAFNPPMADRDQRHIPSYSYGGIVAQIVRVRPGTISMPALANAIFKLAVIKQVHGHEAVRSHVVMVVKAPVHPSLANRKEDRYQSTELRDELIAQYRYDANALNVQIMEADDAQHAAKRLLEWAKGTIAEELDEDGVEELDPDEDF